MTDGWKNRLYFGDNLNILRDYAPEESVDLICPLVDSDRENATESFRRTEAVAAQDWQPRTVAGALISMVPHSHDRHEYHRPKGKHA